MRLLSLPTLEITAFENPRLYTAYHIILENDTAIRVLLFTEIFTISGLMHVARNKPRRSVTAGRHLSAALMLMHKMKDSTRELDFIFRDDAHSRCDRVKTVLSF